MECVGQGQQKGKQRDWFRDHGVFQANNGGCSEEDSSSVKVGKADLERIFQVQ